MSDILIPVIMGLLALGAVIVIFYLVYLKKVEQEVTEGQFFTSSMGPIFYEISGKSGPYLVFIHGLGASNFCWRNIIPAFTGEYRVVTFDLWGFGASCKTMTQPMSLDLQVEILDALLESLQIKKANLICHSMGAQIALWYALKHPDKVDKIIAVAPACHPQIVSSHLPRFSWIAKFTPLILNRKSIHRMLLRLLYDPSFVTEDMVDRYFAPYKDPHSHMSFAAALRILRDVRVFNQLGSLNKEVLILWGDRDRVVPLSYIKAMRNQMPHSQLQTIPTAGHLIFEDQPEWLVEQIRLFLKRG